LSENGTIDPGAISWIQGTGIPMSDATGERSDVSALFDRYKERLRRTVRLRLDRRLTGIVDSSGVLKMARAEFERRSSEPAGTAAGSFLWLRQFDARNVPTLIIGPEKPPARL